MSERKSLKVSSSENQHVEIILEFGHKAVLKDVPIKDSRGRPYTHDWEVWVRSPNAEDRIDSFLEKVVYTLHETFDDPVRRVCKPPFVVAEQGYGSFQIQIDLYFKVVRISWDL